MQAESRQQSQQHLQRAHNNQSALTYVLLNPHARGGSNANLAAQLKKILSQCGLDDALIITDTPQAALQMIHALPSGSRILVAGGDGTIQHLLPALIAGGHTLGVLPMGSGNDNARTLGTYGLALDTAIQKTLLHPASPIDVGEIQFIDSSTGVLHENLFLSSLSVGFDASISLRARQGPAWLFGMPRYLWATLGELRALRHWPIHVTADDKLIHTGPALFASCLNTPSFGGGMPAVPNAKINDGALNLLMAGDIHLSNIY
ncbi:MAG: diacylglycerol kinase family protein [Burkholderiales bacterium]|nr:diacylglycerol kinase family protein [Burkholderiales bacterium]